MKKYVALFGVGLLVLSATAISAIAALQGDYIEVRSADVYVGACFANSEVGLVGKEAILAWRVKQGSWKGVNVDGLSVIAVVKANATLGDPHHNPYPAKAVLILDERASAAQRQALEDLARWAAGRLLDNVVRVETVAIRLEVTGGHHGRVNLVAGPLVRVETRPLCEDDHLCGNEEVYYPPLTKVSSATPVYTLEESFNGQGLGEVWKRVGKRNAFVGTFDF